MRSIWIALLVQASVAAAGPGTDAESYLAADRGVRPGQGGVKILPETFLRGFDPITAYFADDVGPGTGSADDGARILKIEPSWPGAYVWADRRTLQFRPAEPWPPLARFSLETSGARRILTTMMSAPSAVAPQMGSENLKPFRSVSLTFAQPLPLKLLKEMIQLEVRELPGVADSRRQPIKNFTLVMAPRAARQNPATYVLTLAEAIPEGRVLLVSLSLALGNQGDVLWQARLSTRAPFHLEGVECGSARLSSLSRSGAKDQALACGNSGEQPQLIFSAPVADLTLTAFKKLVRLEPSVPDVHFEPRGSRLALRGKFLPDVLYRMVLSAAPIHDDSNRPLQDPGEVVVYFHLGWKSPFLRWSQSTAILEAKGPRTLPLIGYGDARADVRIYRVDPLHPGLWPFPAKPLVIDEEQPPPFPGEEPNVRSVASKELEADELGRHVRLLGSPLVSTLVNLPLENKSGTLRFGLDLGALVDAAVGKNQPGTYLVGLRRLTGKPQRTYVRVQLTNLSLTAVEEREKVVFFVRRLDTAAPVRDATITIEAQRRVQDPVKKTVRWVSDHLSVTTDESGRAWVAVQRDWSPPHRVFVESGQDFLVLDPREPPPRFFANHWSNDSGWLTWLSQAPPPPMNDQVLGFVFTERSVYRPGETVFIKGYVRQRVAGELKHPGEDKHYRLEISGPDGQSRRYPVKWTSLAGFSAEFKDKDAPTGRYTVRLQRGDEVLSERGFRIEAYRIPSFDIQLIGAPTVAFDGPFKVKATARYYAGGSVAGQPIVWTVTARPYHHVPAGRENYLFASSSQFARPGQRRPSEPIVQRGVLDDGGANEITVNPALDLDGSARIYTFEATVTGPDGQQVSAFHETKALPPFTLGMELPRYSAQPFDLEPRIIAIGADGKLLAGQQVAMRLYHRVWHSTLRESQFATGEAKYVTEQEDQRLEERLLKTEDKPLTPLFALKESGVYVVELVSRDKVGRVQSLSVDLYVGGKEAVAWKKSREGVFELATDKKSYRPGDVARIVIQSPYQSGKALVIVEEPEGNRYAWHEVSGGKAVHELRILPTHVPNLPLHVALMRGRLGESKAEDSRYKPSTLASSIDLEIEPSQNQLQVGVEHPETVRPGAKVELVVTLKDEKKNPLAGEVTLWLVDEAVLSLGKEGSLDPLGQMVVRNHATSTVRDTRNTVLGRVAELEESPGGDGVAETDAMAAANRAGRQVVRRNFQTVPFYQATLQVPSSGRLVVPIQVSEDLTNFRVRAVAASGMQRFGFRQSTLRVRLPVIVQPRLPRFVRQGDRFWGGAIARLVDGPEGEVQVKLSLSGAADGKLDPSNKRLLRGEPVQALTAFTAKVTNSASAATLTLRGEAHRLSDGVGDAFEVALPVLPDRGIERFAYLDTLKPGRAELKSFPERPRPGTASQKLVFTSVTGMLELLSGLEYLEGYPHGCLEQKMSRLQGEVAMIGLLRRLGLESGHANQVSAMIRQFFEEAPIHQNEEGLFAFWPGGPGDVQLTAHLVEFIALAKKAGAPVDPKLEARAVEVLKRVLRSDYAGLLSGFRYNQQTAAIRALAADGQLDEHYLIELFHSRRQMDTASLADLATAMSGDPGVFKVNLASLKDELWDAVTIKLHRGQPVFAGLNARRVGWGDGFLGSGTATLATVFESLTRLDPSDPRHEILRDALISLGTASNGFGSTYENRRVLQALSSYLERAKVSGVDRKVELPGHGELVLDDAHKVVTKVVQQDLPLVAVVSGGEVGARIEYQYLPDASGDQVEPLKNGLIVSRSATHLKGDGSLVGNIEELRGQALKMSVGDILEMHAHVTADEDRTHVALVVPFAAGLEPMNMELEAGAFLSRPSQQDSVQPSYVQRLDNEVRYYFLRLPRGTHAFHLRARAATEGSFVHPAAYAEQMYRQQVRGRGAGMRLIITGEHEQ